MISPSNKHAWIFVSHASDDLIQVRRVRNFLEEKGASPLLFHLLALKDPEEFWPIIEKEIAARNFFLYCDSPIAAEREWVRRERATVEVIAKTKPIRIGKIQVGDERLNFAQLEDFLAKTRVFPSYSRHDVLKVHPFLQALEAAGFQLFDHTSIDAGSSFIETMKQEIARCAKDGWVVAFLSSASLNNSFVSVEIEMAQALGAKFVPISIEPMVALPPSLRSIKVFDATIDPTTAPRRLAEELLSQRA